MELPTTWAFVRIPRSIFTPEPDMSPFWMRTTDRATRWATSATEIGVAVGIVVAVAGTLVGDGGSGVGVAVGGTKVAVGGSAVAVAMGVSVGIAVAGGEAPIHAHTTNARVKTSPNAGRSATVFSLHASQQT